MISAYSIFRKSPLELMELYCYIYGMEQMAEMHNKNRLKWLQKAINICKEKIKRRMHD